MVVESFQPSVKADSVVFRVKPKYLLLVIVHGVC